MTISEIIEYTKQEIAQQEASRDRLCALGERVGWAVALGRIDALREQLKMLEAVQ